MAKHHNLGTVIWFEFTRTIKKPSFWAATLSFPILLGAILGIVYYSTQAGIGRQEELAKETFSIAYQDVSELITPEVAGAFEAQEVDDKDAAIAQVRNQNVDAFFYYPAEISKNAVEVYAKDAGLFDNSKYDSVAKQMLTLSANAAINDPELFAIAQGGTSTKLTTYTEDGERSAGWMAAIPPLIFLVLFYFAIAMLGNNLLNSTIEEKENRVTEMILTTLNPTDLIVGKLFATFLAGIVQALILIVPVVAAYVFLGSDGATAANLPDLGIVQDFVVNPITMLVGFLLFVGGMLVFTGTLVAIGAIMPTAKEAGQWFGIAMIAMFVPFYIIQLILSDPEQIVVGVFTYFPFTAPVTAMLRNAFGSLTAMEATVVIAMLLLLGALIIRLAVRLFRYGAMEYSNKLSLKRLFK